MLFLFLSYTSSFKDFRRRAVKCVIFPTGSSTPEGIWTRTKTSLPRGLQIHPQDLDLDMAFPDGSISFRLDSVPGNGFPLPNGLRIFISKAADSAPINKSIRRRFGWKWRGNLMLAKYGRGYKDGLIQIQLTEPTSLDLIVGL